MTDFNIDTSKGLDLKAVKARNSHKIKWVRALNELGERVFDDSDPAEFDVYYLLNRFGNKSGARTAITNIRENSGAIKYAVDVEPVVRDAVEGESADKDGKCSELWAVVLSADEIARRKAEAAEEEAKAQAVTNEQAPVATEQTGGDAPPAG